MKSPAEIAAQEWQYHYNEGSMGISHQAFLAGYKLGQEDLCKAAEEKKFSCNTQIGDVDAIYMDKLRELAGAKV